MAEYRLGQYEEALSSLIPARKNLVRQAFLFDHSDEPQRTPIAKVCNPAFMAMTLSRLGLPRRR